MRIFSILFFMAASLVPASAQEEDSCVHLTEITVTGLTGSTRISQHPAPVAVVGRDFLRSRMSSNIVDAIARRPGVSQITTGAAISKPVIRGLGYNRVLVVSGGVRQEGQQWGDEHGLEVDGQGVASVEILKGPASLMYGSDAMAGVLILHDEPRAAPGTMKADLTTEYQSNNGLFGCSADFAGNEGRVEWNWRYSAKFAHDYKNRNDGYVSGSRFREQALSGMLGTYGDWGSSRLRLTYYHLTPGIVEGERDEETGALLREDNGKHYSMLLPFQQVYHYKAVSDNSLTLGDGMLKIITAYQQNRRKEFEESRDECGLDFRLHTLNYDVRYVLPETGGWQANIGVGGMYQRSINEGEEFLIPSYNLFDIGAFVTVSKRLAQRWNISGGVRFDNRSLHSHPLSDDGELRFSTFSRTFSGISGSIGVVCNISEHLDAKLNVSSGFRAPNLSELGCNGVHEGTFRYETGDNRLKQEKSLQFDAGIDYASEPFSLELSLFANHIDNYIYLSRDGETYREELPVYRYAAGDARLFGGEIRLILHPFTHLHFENSFSYVNSVLLHHDEDSRYLPQTPAPRWVSTLHYDMNIGRKSSSNALLFAEIEADCNFRQNNVYAADDTETPTPSYILFNLSVGADIRYKAKKRLSLYLTANNIFDCIYQNHLSRLKYADADIVTGKTGVFEMGRNIGVKAVVPIEF